MKVIAGLIGAVMLVLLGVGISRGFVSSEPVVAAASAPTNALKTLTPEVEHWLVEQWEAFQKAKADALVKAVKERDALQAELDALKAKK